MSFGIDEKISTLTALLCDKLRFVENNIVSKNEILKLVDVTKDFYPSLPLSKLLKFDLTSDKPTRALEHISFSLERGKVLGVLGPNGAGKTTLLKIISGIVIADKGTVTINEMSFDKHGDAIRSIIGLSAYQEKGFYWRLTGRQNLEFFASLYGLDQRNAKSRMEELFHLLSVTYQDKRFDSYSAGMKQTLSLIRSLMHDPELLLLDEPTKSLDYASSKRLINFIKNDLCRLRGKTIITTTHQMNEALESSDIFAVLDRGDLKGFGTLEQLRRMSGKDTGSLGDIMVAMTEKGSI